MFFFFFTTPIAATSRSYVRIILTIWWWLYEFYKHSFQKSNNQTITVTNRIFTQQYAYDVGIKILLWTTYMYSIQQTCITLLTIVLSTKIARSVCFTSVRERHIRSSCVFVHYLITFSEPWRYVYCNTNFNIEYMK